MRIDCPATILSGTYDTIDAMISSRYLSQHKNLHTLIFFLLGVTPALDAMSPNSQRLTDLLMRLNAIRGRTRADRRDVAGLLRNLGRNPCQHPVESISEKDEED